MGKIIDFDRAKTYRQMKETTGEKGVIYEIYLTVVKYVYQYIPMEFDNPVDELNTESKLQDLYEGDQDRFAMTFAELMDYWQLTPLDYQDIPHNQEFEVFETIGDLCLFIEKRIN